MLQEGRAAVEAHAEAQVKPIVCSGASTVLRVVLTAVPLASPPATDGAAPTAPGPEPVARRLSLTVVPRGLKVALGGRRTRTLRLSPGGTAQATFRLVGVARGPGDVSVVIRGDDDEPLATLRLTVEVIGSDDHDQTGVARVNAAVPARPVRQYAAEPTRRIIGAVLGSTA
ncbi:DUF7363 domain-containing protein [Agromyces sp. ZXT2-6]|uniref:DUF7363 domain-containing protein n=1 Tax=Agromyces sp. ZXT2-6 TaxID=3461153 RepID=UPI004054A1F9